MHATLALTIFLLLVAQSFQEFHNPIDQNVFHSSMRHKSSIFHSSREGEGAGMRLPRNLLPTTYSITLLPFIELHNFTTQGSIDIFVDCMEDTHNITLNSADIDIDKLSIVVNDKIRSYINEQLICEMKILFIVSHNHRFWIWERVVQWP